LRPNGENLSQKKVFLRKISNLVSLSCKVVSEKKKKKKKKYNIITFFKFH